MKNKSTRLIIFYFISLLLISCDENTPEPVNNLLYQNGVFIVNEGNFSDSDGSLSFYSLEDEEVTNQVFEEVNERPLAAVFQSLRFYDGKGFLIDQNGRMEVVQESDLSSLHSISTNLIIPRYFAGYQSSGYVTDWGPYDDNFNSNESRIHVYDLTTMEVLEEIETSSRPEDILLVNDKLYVANSGTNLVSVYDPADNSLLTETEVSLGPTRFVVDNHDNLWVICTGAFISTGALTGINTTTDAVMFTLDLANYPPNGRIAINGTGDEIYFMTEQFSEDFTSTTNTVYSVRLSADGSGSDIAGEPQEIVSGTNWYGLGFDPVNEVLYIADAAAFQANGQVFQFGIQGSELGNFNVERGPRDFVFTVE